MAVVAKPATKSVDSSASVNKQPDERKFCVFCAVCVRQKEDDNEDDDNDNIAHR